MQNRDIQADILKQKAAEAAVDFVTSGMVVGLGHGSTAMYAVKKIARLLAEGQLKDIVGIPCSQHVQRAALEFGIPISELDSHPQVDLTIDGADEVDGNMNLIKGGGGALLKEKLVAKASAREIIVVDESKLSPQLGTHFPLPVEVLEISWEDTGRFVEQLGAKVNLRRMTNGENFRTDSENLVLDCDFGPIDDPTGLDVTLLAYEGVVDHGLFIDLATDLLVAGPAGITHRQKARPLSLEKD